VRRQRPRAERFRLHLVFDSRMLPDVDRLRAELKQLMQSWEYAYAMGHGCTVGDHPEFRATRERVADLRARIQELTD
jgi:hypothetical protein